MKIQVNSDELAKVIHLHTSVIGSEHISIKAEDDALHLYSTNKGRSLYRRLFEVEVLEEGEFSTDPFHFVGVIQGRKDVTISFDEETVTVKSGKYTAQVAVIPFEEIEVPSPEEDANELNFETAEVDVLIGLCNQAQLTSPVLDGGNLPVLLHIDDKGTQVCCIDNFHVSHIQSKEVTRETPLDVVLPSGALTLLQQAASDDTYRVLMANNSIYAEGANFKFATPSEQVTAQKNLGHVAMLRKKIKGTQEVTTVRCSREDLNVVLGNVFSVAETSIPITLEVSTNKKKKQVFNVGTKSSFGSAFDELQAEIEGDDVSANFTADMLGEVIAKIKAEEVTLNILPQLMHVSESHGATRSLLILIRV